MARSILLFLLYDTYLSVWYSRKHRVELNVRNVVASKQFVEGGIIHGKNISELWVHVKRAPSVYDNIKADGLNWSARVYFGEKFYTE